MKIAIIGTGNVGKAIGSSLVRAGHEVTFAARDAAKTRQVASEMGASAAANAADAASDADVILLAVPFQAFDWMAAELAERYAAILPGARVAKAFNTVFVALQADPTALGTTLDLLYATDDAAARTAVAAIARSIGFRPVNVGPLAAARELEAMAWLNIRLQMITAGDWRSTFVLLGAPAAATAV